MKKNTWLPGLLLIAVLALAGGGLWYGGNVYIPRRNAEKAEAVRLAQEAEAAAAAQAAEDDVQAESAYDYSIPVDEAALREKLETESLDPDAGTTVTTDENGDVWIERDYTGDPTGLKIVDPTDPDAGQSAAKANIASGGGKLPVDENGVYYETFPETAAAGSAGSSGGNPSDSGGTTPAASGSGGNSSGEASSDSGSGSSGSGSGGAATPASSGSDGNSSGESSSGSGSGGGTATTPETGSSSGTPKQGDIKWVDGQMYRYNSIFGWLIAGDEHSYGIKDTGGWTELGERVPNANF